MVYPTIILMPRILELGTVGTEIEAMVWWMGLA